MKKSNGGLVQKQKAYFARARTQLQKETNSTVAPFQPGFLCNTQARNRESLEETRDLDLCCLSHPPKTALQRAGHMTMGKTMQHKCCSHQRFFLSFGARIA